MNSSRLSRLLVCVASLGCASHLLAQSVDKSVANVPPTDPTPTNVPQIVSSMQGVHPRLLFTTAEIAALKQQIDSDPTLGKAYKDCVNFCKTVQIPKSNPDFIAQGDTPAIWKGLGLYPEMAYVYAIDHDPAIKQKIIDMLTLMLNQPYWSPVNLETDNSMGAACNMEMVGILYDTVYNDLTPDLRDKLAAKMLLHCRRMYWLGHQMRGLAIKYWQFDPQPNHRWYRDAGLGACLLSIADDKDLDTGYLLQQFKAEMDLVMKWYPPQGDCHEGAGYQTFGYIPIVTAVEMTDRILGTNYLRTSGLKNAWTQQLYYWDPARNSDMSYGDDQNNGPSTFSNNDAAFFLGPRLTGDKDAQAALVYRMKKKMLPGRTGTPFAFQWGMLAFYDPTVGEGSLKTLPTYRLFPDMGAATMRDTWDDNSVIMTFKCGPYGGYKLNEYRMANPDAQGHPHAINVAHDDPDANEFALSFGNGFAFHPGVYSVTNKVTRQHNTIIVDDKGQVGEGYGFTQPVDGMDMRQLSYLTGWKAGSYGRVIIEGEAGNAYRGASGPDIKKMGGKVPDPVLTKFRRTAIWIPGEYILILDDIAGAGSHKITWLGDSPKAAAGANGHYTATTETGGQVNFQLLSNQDIANSIVPVLLDGRFGNDPVQQFQFTATSPAIKFACLIDPWGRKPEMTMTDSGGVATVTIHSAVFNDTWTWHEATDAHTPSQIDGKRNGLALISLTPADKAPTE